MDSQADVYELHHEIQQEFLSYTPQVGGDKLPWGKFVNALYTHPDRQYRERVWQAQVPIADKLREKFLQLVRHRNQWARQNGYDNYIDLVLAPQGLSRDSVLERYVDLEEVTLDSYKSVLSRIRSRLPFKDPGIWDLTYFPQSRLSALEGHTFNGSSPDVVALIKALGIPLGLIPFRAPTHPSTALFLPVLAC